MHWYAANYCMFKFQNQFYHKIDTEIVQQAQQQSNSFWSFELHIKNIVQ